MKFNEYISKNSIFTKNGLLKNADSVKSAEKQLELAIKSGKVVRIRHGVYASNYDRFHDQTVNCILIPQTIDEDAVLSFSGATKLYGVQYNQLNQIFYYSIKSIKDFSFEGTRFRCKKIKPHKLKEVQINLQKSEEMLINVTGIEQTIIDCLDKPYLNGGFEETIRSLSEFPYINDDEMLRLLAHRSKNLIAKVGWFLSIVQKKLSVSANVLNKLEQLIDKGPYKFSDTNNSAWSSRWKLCLPESEEEILSWVK